MAKKHPKEITHTSAAFKQQKIVTRFDKKGRVISVEAQEQAEENMKQFSIGDLIDHTLLKPDATQDQILNLCREAVEHHLGAICVNGCWVPLCREALKGTDVKLAATIGFPLGAMDTKSKAYETKQLVKQGAVEIDMVMNVGALKSGDFTLVANDIHEVVRAAHKRGAIVKVIIETCLLTKEEKVTACLLCKDAGSDFVKTSTGFSGPGANLEDVALMRSVVGPEMGVKAAGGVRSYADALKMVEAGATRIGTSSGIKIVEEEKAARS